MPYDPNRDPTNGYTSPITLCRKQEVVTPADATDLQVYARFIEVTGAGNLVYLPVENDDADTVTVTGAPVGWRSSCAVRRVLSTGTSATVVACRDD